MNRRDSPSTPPTSSSATDRSPDANGSEASESLDFIRTIVADDVASDKHGGRVVTRFPPEPNGYLHIGHAKSICLNFGLAQEYEQGVCHLRFDDTNPATEDPEYVESIQRDIRWLGFDWGENLFFASDYFEFLYECAEKMIADGMAYVDSLSEEEIRDYRGTITEPGRPSPDRDRSVEENFDLFRRMRSGEFEDGAYVLRAKGDLAAANMKMRDPLLFRIRHAHHYRRGDEWPIYPMYDFTHGLSDWKEGITHSFCTLEFENNRALYDWFLELCVDEPHPQQIEFARLNINYTVLSKRKLIELVRDGHVNGWDDPRLPTISGLRRRGVTPESIRGFCDTIGVAKSNSVVDVAQLEHAIRDDLNYRAPRVLAVLDPLKVTISNWPEGPAAETTEWIDAPSWPHDVPNEGSRKLPFSGNLVIERSDFDENPPKRFHRLAPGREVRLRYGYFIRCEKVIKNDDGEVIELICTYDPKTRGGSAPDGRKVKGTIHWLSAEHAVPVEVRLYDRLFAVERPGETKDVSFLEELNPNSLEVKTEALVEPSLNEDENRTNRHFQFERHGYFYLEPEDSTPERMVFNRVVPLRDSWAKTAPGQHPKRPKSSRSRDSGTKTKAQPEPAPVVVERVGDAATRFARLTSELNLGEETAGQLADHPEIAEFFEKGLAQGGVQATTLANWTVNEVMREAKDRSLDDLPFGPTELVELVRLIDGSEITGTAAKEVFEEMIAHGGSPTEIVEAKGLRRLDDDSALNALVDSVITDHPGEVAGYRDGKTQLLGFFIGKVMQASKGRAEAQSVRKALIDRLAG